MKKIASLFVLVLLAGISIAQDTPFNNNSKNHYGEDWDPSLPTLRFGEREPTYYYWSNHWYDSCGFLGSTTPNFCIPCNIPNPGSFKSIYARPFLTDSTLKVIGLAGSFSIVDSPGLLSIVYDTVLSHRNPEYLHLYESYARDDSAMVLLGELRIDTVRPRYIMQVPCISNGIISYFDSIQIREAYFDKPIEVRDSFYVGVTCNNNEAYWEFIGEEINWNCQWRYMHPRTLWWSVQNRSQVCPPYPNHFKYKVTDSDPVNAMYNLFDTTIWYRQENNWNYFIVFPIFDTTGMNIDWHTHEDTVSLCDLVRNLSVLDINPGDVTLTWSGDGNSLWDISIGHSSTLPDDGTIIQTNNIITTISPLDTATWYVAYVRTVCDEGVGRWSDSIRFFIPSDPNGGGGQQGISTTINQYTNVFPNPTSSTLTIQSSFGIQSVDIIDLKGRLVLSRKVGALQATLPVDDLPHGQYLIRIYTSQGLSVKKVTIN